MVFISTIACLSSGAYAQRPLAFDWQGERLVVEAIQAEWRTPQAKFFRVRTCEGGAYELVYDELNDLWRVTER